MSRFTVHADQFFNAPTEVVFSHLCRNYATTQLLWDPAITEISPTDPLALGSRALVTRIFRNRPQRGEMEVTDFREGDTVEVSIRFPKGVERRRISCAPLNYGGTHLRVVISSELSILARIIAPLTTGLIERALVLSLRAAKPLVEATPQ